MTSRDEKGRYSRADSCIDEMAEKGKGNNNYGGADLPADVMNADIPEHVKAILIEQQNAIDVLKRKNEGLEGKVEEAERGAEKLKSELDAKKDEKKYKCAPRKKRNNPAPSSQGSGYGSGNDEYYHN